LTRRKPDAYRSGMARKASAAAKALDAMMRATGRGRGRHSPLYLWLRRHHDELAAGFAQNAPAWQALADHLGGQGVVDANGNKPTARGARDAWWRVRRDLAKARAKPPAPSQPKPGEIAPGVRAVAHPAPPPPPLASDRPRMPPLKPRNRQP
jgi:hypothetical protein